MPIPGTRYLALIRTFFKRLRLTPTWRANLTPWIQEIRGKIKRWINRKWILRLSPALILIALGLVIDFLLPLPTHRLFPDRSTQILARDGTLLRAYTARDDIWRMYTPLAGISPLHQKMVRAYEDRWFYWHLGINPVALVRAAWLNLKAKKIRSGGSTITMQIARMMEPKSRTFRAKFQEMFRALQLEWHFSKKELLEIYFNLMPYGGNIEGVGAAAWIYFGKPPAQLSIGEIALLTALPNSPTRLRPDLNGSSARAARDKVLTRLLTQHVIQPSQYQDARSETVPSQRRTLPFLAPHACDFLKQRDFTERQLRSTLDLHIQTICQHLLTQHVQGLSGKGITNGAVVVIDNPRHEVLALVGSGNFFNNSSSGQVNGALAPRSPGSALKPFVYALALDAGLISHRSVLEDVPVDYSGYSPENFDGLYHGVVTVEQALAQSLNVPAINLTAALKKNTVYRLLKKAGFTTLSRPEAQYGLPIILGACEVKLLELTNFYSCLANGGVFYPWRMRVGETPGEGQVLFSPESAFIITEILAGLSRPDLPTAWESSLNLPKVSWKTGTSYGHKDAWSIGYNPDWTIGVWIGNFSGAGVPELVGAEVAAPLLFDIFNALARGRNPRWFAAPSGLGVREVCVLSGMPASAICPRTQEEYYLPGKSPHIPCTLHQKRLIDDQTHTVLCNHCSQGRRFHEVVFEQWPAKLATWMERNGYPIPKIPPHYPKCTSLILGSAPIIRSPSANCEYILREGVDPEYQKILLDASVSNDVRRIYWFVDGKVLLTCSPAEKVFYKPTVGNHQLVCMDELGRGTEMVIKIR
ncbi:penicillin-binding protein 1C [candidate division KSB1 bacterium]|nr:penicillin-binding protein 1C [candidate division KSB1 bacterium]